MRAFRVSGLENGLEYLADKGLDKEKLSEIRKGQVTADKLEPVGKERQKIEACIVGVIDKGGEEAHGRAHESHGGADDCRFKEHGVSACGVKDLAGQLEGQGGYRRSFQG